MPKPGGCSNPTCVTWSPSPRGTEIGSGACWQGDLGREHFLLERRRHSGEFRVFVDEHGIPPEGAGHDKGISERDSMGSFDIGGDGAERVIGVLPSDVQQLEVGNGLPGEFLTVVIGSDVLDFREADKASDNLSLDRTAFSSSSSTRGAPGSAWRKAMSAEESSRNRSAMFAGKATEFVILTRPVARPFLQEVNVRLAASESSVKGMNDLQGA